MIKVVKFGGSSLASAEKFEQVRKIVESDPDRKIVIVSAPGKINSSDNKVTDLLYICHAHVKYHAGFDDVFSSVEEKYRAIARGCGLTLDLDREFEQIRASMKNASVDEIVSRGEYLNAKLMAEYLGYTFVDSRDWLFFNYDGTVDYKQSYETLSMLFARAKALVLPGFYGSMPDGSIRTFSRGGSDVTGALAAAAVGADAYENWTDVSGILMADPRIVDNPRPIERITFSELRELSYMGAEVLHEETVFPIREADIPLYIKNTNDPDAPGTLIKESFPEDREDEKTHFVTGITGKKNYSILTMSKSRMTEEKGFIATALNIFDQFGVLPENISTGIDSVSFVFSTSSAERRIHELSTELKNTLKPDRLTVDNDISLIAIVGRRMAWNIGVSGKVFATLGSANVNIRMIAQGSDEINILIGVGNDDFSRTIQILYNSFT